MSAHDEPDITKLVGRIINSGLDALTSIGKFIIEHPDKAAAIFAGTVTLLNATKHLQVTHRQKYEDRRKDYSYYDPHTGMRWDLRRKMTNSDRVYIQDRVSCGASMGDILRERGLI